MNDERVNGHTVCYHSISNTCRNWTATAAQVSGVDCLASLKHGQELFQPAHFKHQYKGSRKQFGTCATHFVYIIQLYTQHYDTFKQRKVGRESIRCGFNGARAVACAEWFHHGSGGFVRVWNMCQLQCDVCSTEEVTQWRVCFTPMNSALFGTAQHRTGLDWTGLDRHCCHCNGAVLLSTSNYPKIALTFQGRKSSQFLASVLKCKKKGEHMCLLEHSWSSALSFLMSPKAPVR